MAIVFQNSFDGPDDTAVTVENSGDHGDEVTQVVGDVRYATDRATAGTSSIRIPDASAVQGIAVTVSSLGLPQWAIRGYLYAPTGGAIGIPLLPGQLGTGNVSGIALRPDIGLFSTLGTDIDAPAAALTDTWVRWEARRAGSSGEQIQVRLWWTNPHSIDPPDWSINGNFDDTWALGSIQVTTHADAGPGYLDELAIANTADWLGPAIPVVEDETELDAEGNLGVAGSSGRTDVLVAAAHGGAAVAGAKHAQREVHAEAGAVFATTGDAHRSGTVDLTVHAGLDADGDGDWGYTAELDAEAQLGITGTSARRASATLDAEVSLDGAPHKAVSGQASISTGAMLDVEGTPVVREDGVVEVDAVATLAVTGRKAQRRAVSMVAATGFRAVAGQPSEPWPLDVHVEAQLGGAWVDLTRDRPTPEVWLHQPLSITAGRQDEASAAQPAEVSFTLDNPHGDWTPRNPASPFYGQWQLGAPVRVRVAGLDEEPDNGPILADAFDRSVTDGWGSADTGQAWTVYSNRPSDFSVDAGVGRITLPTTSAWPEIYSDPINTSDIDVAFSVAVDQLPAGRGMGAVWTLANVRYDPESLSGYTATIGLLVDSGAPDGRVVLAQITRDDEGTLSGLTPGVAVGDITYDVDVPLRVRIRAEGPEIRLRVWPDGTREPAVWHAQAHDTTYTAGSLGFAALTSEADDTPTPITVSIRDVEVRHATPPPASTRLVGEVASIEPTWPHGDLSHPGYAGEARVQVTAAGILRRLGQGASPVESAITRTVAGWRPLAYWPCEDNAGAHRAASAISGAPPLRTNGWAYQESDTLPGSKPLPTIGDRANIRGPVPAPTVTTGEWELNLLYSISESDWPGDDDGEVTLVGITTSGTVTLWSIRLEGTGTDARGWHLRAWDADDTQVVDQQWTHETANLSSADGWRWLRFSVEESGSGVAWEWEVRNVEVPGTRRLVVSGTVPNARAGHIERIGAREGGMPTGMSLGHIALFGRAKHFAYGYAVRAHAGETVRERLDRLSAQHNVPVEIHGAAPTRVGAQQIATFLELVEEAAEVDYGLLHETRHQVGLAYRDRASMYDQTPHLHLDASAESRGDIAEPFAPLLDDQGVRNDVEVQRTDGSAARVVDTDGPMGVDAIGRYDESVTINASDDVELPDHASWRLHMGTWPGMRYSAVSPALTVRPQLISGWTRTELGDGIQVTGLPPQHPTEVVDLIAQGYTETIERDRWDVEVTTTPAGPWDIGHWHNPQEPEPDARDRYDTAGSSLSAPVDDTATTLAVSSIGTGWTTDGADMPFDIRINGEVMRVTAASGGGRSQTLTVQRGINGVVKPHPPGADVRLAFPAVVGL